MKKITKVLIVMLAIIVVLGGVGFGFIYANLNKIYVKDEDTKVDAVEIKEEQGKEIDGVTNILLVGTDGANVERSNRSDSVMLVTIDNINKDIRISSISRDTYVDIPGYSKQKMNHAYAYGGIDLLKKVFEVNFGIKVDKYIAVNFVSFMDIIDEIGGVVVNVEEKDVNEVNKYIDHCYDYYYDRKDKVKKEYITGYGTQRLNGYQALAFSRIRYTDSAYARENRHKEVAQSVYKEFLNSGVNEYKRAAEILLENTKTNISPMEMINLGFTALKINDKNIAQFQFPMPEHRNGHIISKKTGWVIEWDKDANLTAWHNFINGNTEK